MNTADIVGQICMFLSAIVPLLFIIMAWKAVFITLFVSYCLKVCANITKTYANEVQIMCKSNKESLPYCTSNITNTTPTSTNKTPPAQITNKLLDQKHETNVHIHVLKKQNHSKHDRGFLLYNSFEKIGDGVFSRVYKTIRKETQHIIALKVLSKKHQHSQRSFTNELMILSNISHSNIVKFYDAHEDPKYFYLEMELCSGGDLLKYIKTKGKINEKNCRKIIYQILDAIRCVHKLQFVHRDLKLENIVFVNPNCVSDIRLIDFGLSLFIKPNLYYNEFVGTPSYLSPERFRTHTGAELKKSDIWAIGLIMFEILTGYRCFSVGENILNTKMKLWPTDLILSSNTMGFFNKLIQYDALRRCSAQQALKDEWFKESKNYNENYVKVQIV
eukprot:384079_1